MRKEHVEYIKDLPINIYLADIRKKPLYWQDSIQIIFLLEGSVEISIENETYRLKEKEIEIININEVYSINSDEKNLLLILQMDPNFFERYYEDAREVFFYTDSPEKENQDIEKYQQLRTYLSIITYESLAKLDDYKDRIEENLLQMFYHLLNNFHYLYYEGEGESLKDDQEQMERYHRIVKHLSNNYMNKVSLQDIAKREFLSSQYLSYKIKNILGQSFNEFLNQIRVEESTKLLLDTDKKVSEISDEVGFSHVRYYNKHFKLHYKMTPIQYRQKHQIGQEDLEKASQINLLDLKTSLTYLDQYILDYERYNYDNKIKRLDLSLKDDVIAHFKRPDIIKLGDASLLLEEENRRILEEAQGEIGFEYALVNKLFSDDMDIYKGKNQKFINWTRVENVLDFLKKLKLFPVISSEGIEKSIIDDFINHFSSIYSEDVKEWLNFDIRELEPVFLNDQVCEKYDTISMVPYILYNYIENDQRIVLELIDLITRETDLYNDTFFGGNGIFTSNHLNKPSYYALMFLANLGEDIIARGDGYIFTKSSKGYQLLFYNPSNLDEDFIYKNRAELKLKERKISTNIFGMEEDFQVTKYDLNENSGSVYDKWEFLGGVESLDKYHWNLLKEYTHPKISFYFNKKSSVLNLQTSIKAKGAVLYELNRGLS